ncbi:hypothetical protein QR680_017346 [Steinernema hermaphroditum]|uniref:G-protein coupled receptors family 1 profile domain-containing protein n=1 Tax=Steinernema hermaphroditum TaxID=289476 RepID=A0AA39HF89_9BILA|nr:hypothetical protein QR680_017346 [Steinernema hermaphroditum]
MTRQTPGDCQKCRVALEAIRFRRIPGVLLGWCRPDRRRLAEDDRTASRPPRPPIVTIEVSPWTTTAVAAPEADDHVATGLPVDDLGALLLEDSRIRQVDFIAHSIVMPWLLGIGFVNQCINVLTLSRLLYNGLNGFLYLRASAVTDILSILATIPFCVRHASLHSPHSFVAMFYHAHIELPLINSLITASALCIVAMTIDRCLSIYSPIEFHKTPEAQHAQRIRLTIALLFVLSIGVFAPSAWERKLDSQLDAANRTVWVIRRNKELSGWRPFQAYLIFRELTARLGPIVILVILNFMISQRIQDTFAISAHPANAKRPSIRRRTHKHVRITRLLVITSTTFILCTLPASLLSIFINNTKEDSLGLQIFRAVANLLQVTSYLYNFYLYALFSEEYRKECLNVLGCSDRQRTSVTTEQPFGARSMPLGQPSKPLREKLVDNKADSDTMDGDVTV